MSIKDFATDINEFESHYKYDCTYMRNLLDSSPEGYAKFDAFMPMVSHIEKLSPNDYWVAKLAAMQIEDCGDCLQLNIRMALESGVDKNIVHAVINGGSDLEENLRDVYHYAKGVAGNSLNDEALVKKIEARFNTGELLEMGMCIASAKVFPTMKRAVGSTKACSIMEFEI